MPTLDFVGTIVLTTIIVVNINAVISALAASRAAQLSLAVALGLWIGLQIAVASAGLHAGTTTFIGLGVALPLVAAAVAAYVSPRVRAAMLALPQSLLVGLNASRVLGVFFLILAADGRLGGPFPQSAGWGDIVAGALAVALAFAIARGGAGPRSVLAWNLFGALDLVAAVVLGLVSTQGSPVQLIHLAGGADAMGMLPWSLIPTVLVPFYLIVHGIVFLQLREAAGGQLAGGRRLPA